MSKLNVALIGQGFMGRTHSNAWGQVNRFFKPPLQAVMHTVFGQAEENPQAFADNWGWQRSTTNWQQLVCSPEIGLVDVVTPNYMHAPPAKAAIAAGKPCSCEKPIAGSLADAREMVEAARKANVKTFVWFNYRRVPAVGLAHRLVKEGRLGEIRHVRAAYLQDWARRSRAPAVAFRQEPGRLRRPRRFECPHHRHGPLRHRPGNHRVCGAIAETFIKERTLPSGVSTGGIAAGARPARSSGKGPVTVDDTVLFLARFSGGAVGSFEAARQATGNQNRNTLELNGTKGSIKFDFERMNELQYYDATLPREVQGWSTIMCTHGGDHPYVGNWWPDAHLIGYEHGFVNQAYDILRVLAGQQPTLPIPDFNDAYQTQRVLEAAMIAATEGHPVKLDQVK